MNYTKDELLFIETLKEMGLDFKEGQGEVSIEGVPAAEYLEKHDIFKADEEQYISLDIFGKEIAENEIYTLDSEALLQAA